jgi:rubredoxin
MDKYTCDVCGYDYDPEVGDPDNGVAAGTPWGQVPEEWICPVCSADKGAFEVA